MIEELENLFQKFKSHSISFNTIEELSIFFFIFHGGGLKNIIDKIVENPEDLVINQLVEVGIFASKTQVHQAIKDNRLFINNIKITQKTVLNEITPINIVNNYIGIDGCFIVKTSKTNYDIFYK